MGRSPHFSSPQAFHLINADKHLADWKGNGSALDRDIAFSQPKNPIGAKTLRTRFNLVLINLVLIESDTRNGAHHLPASASARLCNRGVPSETFPIHARTRWGMTRQSEKWRSCTR